MSRARTFADLATASEAGSLGKRNMIINGAMNIAQRATSSTGVPTSAKYYPTVDRFAMEVNGTDGRLTMTKQAITDLPGFNNAIKLDCTTADTSIAAAEYGAFTYIVEAQDCQRMRKGHSDAKAVTLSFYVKGTAKTYLIEMQDADNTRHNTQQFSVTSDWNRVVLTFAADTTGKIDDDNGQGIIIHLWFHAGSSYTGGTYTANTWASVTANNRAAGIGSFFSSTDNEFFITGVQLEVGEVATPFEDEEIGITLARCRRYYYKPNTANDFMGSLMAPDGNANDFIGAINFPTEMRASPTYTGTPVENGTASTLNGQTSYDTNAVCLSFVRMTDDGNSARRGLNIRGEVDAEL
jgi:hypothetical protein